MTHNGILPSHPAFARQPLALTMGDPAGVGGDVALKAWVHRHQLDLPPFVMLDDPERLHQLACRLGLRVPIKAVANLEAGAALFAHALPILPLAAPICALPGQPSKKNAPAILESIQRGFSLTHSGHAAALVTNPIHKKNLSQEETLFTGHTDYLGRLANLSAPPIMMMASEALRVVPVTVHIPLKDVVKSLSVERLVACGTIVHDALQKQFSIRSPRLAVSGLNPHAGEDGVMGNEEHTLITPAIKHLRQGGIQVTGPWSADTLFHEEARRTYDVAICMYHDQALIPFKTLSFYKGANITLGLPIIRTSPDHGTAFDKAGSGQACEGGLVTALKTAAHMAIARCPVV